MIKIDLFPPYPFQALPQNSKLVHPVNRNFGRIVGGDEAEPHSVPNIVALSITSGFQTFFCGGSIIGKYKTKMHPSLSVSETNNLTDLNFS